MLYVMSRTLEKTRPYIASKVLETYAQTHSISKAAAAGGVARATVAGMLARNPDDTLAAQKHIAAQALTNSALFSESVTKSKVKKLNALQMVIGAKVAGQHALEMLGTALPAVQINVAVLERAGNHAEVLQQAMDKLRASMSKPIELVVTECDAAAASATTDNPDTATAIPITTPA